MGQRPYIRSAPFSPHKCPGFQEEEPVALAPAYHQYNQAAASALTVDRSKVWLFSAEWQAVCRPLLSYVSRGPRGDILPGRRLD